MRYLIILSIFLVNCKSLDYKPATMTIQGDSLITEYQIKFDTLKTHTAYLSDKNDKMAIAMIEAKNVSDECFNVVERVNLQLDSLRIKCFAKNDTLIERLEIVTDKGKGFQIRTTIIDNNTIKMSEYIEDLVVEVDPEILQSECDRCEKLGKQAEVESKRKWRRRCFMILPLLIVAFFIGKYSSIIGSGFGMLKGIVGGFFGK